MNLDSSMLNGNDIADYRTRIFFQAYIAMALQARVRTQAPSDGLGNTELSEEELEDPKTLRDEGLEFAAQMLKQDEDTDYHVFGCIHGPWGKALAYSLQAAQFMCAGGDVKPFIERLLEMALAEMRAN